MKLSEMNKRERKAYMNMVNACNWLLGELENTTMDYSHDSEEYKNAVAKLQNEELLVNELYSMTTTAIYNAGGVCFNEKAVQEELRDINFCGKEWIMERCRRRIKKELATICIG